MSIRNTILNQRKSLSDSDQKKLSQEIIEKVKKIPMFHESQRIAFYEAINGEARCTELIEYAWNQDKTVFLPVLGANILKFVSVTSHQVLVKNHYGIKEPLAMPETTFNASDLDLVFVPLVAFDAQRNRIGMGKGYYDKTFAFIKDLPPLHKNKRPFLVGLAYEFQKVAEIHPNSWDIPLDMVITEKQLY